MSKSNSFENSWLRLIFAKVSIAGLATGPTTGATAAAIDNLWVSLHDADPGEAGDQTTNEATYGGYARVSVARTTVGWTVTSTTGNSVSPVASISFPECTAGSSTVTHMGIGSASSGAGVLYYSGTVTPNISVSSGVTPSLTTASTIQED